MNGRRKEGRKERSKKRDEGRLEREREREKEGSIDTVGKRRKKDNTERNGTEWNGTERNETKFLTNQRTVVLTQFNLGIIDFDASQTV